MSLGTPGICLHVPFMVFRQHGSFSLCLLALLLFSRQTFFGNPSILHQLFFAEPQVPGFPYLNSLYAEAQCMISFLICGYVSSPFHELENLGCVAFV